MESTSSSNSSSLSTLKGILARPAPLELSKDDIELLLPHLDTSEDCHSLVLAILSRSTSPSSPPSSLTLQSIQSTLESLLTGTDSTELVQGLSLLSALLQVSPSFVTTSLFSSSSNSTGIPTILKDVVEHITSPLKLEGKGKEKQAKEELALIELLSLASGQPGMRSLVEESAGDWLESVLDRRDDGYENMRALAGVGIVKLRLGKKEASTSTTGLPQPPQAERTTKWKLEDLGELLVDLAIGRGKKEEEEGDDERTLLACLEGLAYLTLTPNRKIKQLASQPQMLDLLFSFASEKVTTPTASSASRDYAVSTLLNHLTSFPPTESKESEAAQVERLKRFASAGGTAGGGGADAAASEKESVEEVTKRVSLIARHSPSPIPTLRLLCLSPSLQTRRLVGSILHSLVTPQPLRGHLLQAGVPRLLLSLIRNIPTPFDVVQDLDPVQALSKLLITANPLLIFGPTPSSPLLLEATTALTLPFNTVSSTPLLATFETLMALTNIASLDPGLTDKLARLQLRDKSTTSLMNVVEELLLNQNTMVRRAATELVCNLVGSEPGILYFEPTLSTSSSSSRLHLLLALSSSEDVPTRLASSGALTSLVYSPSISTTLARNEKYLDLLIGLLEDEEAGVRHRGYEVWRGMGEVIGSIEKGDEARRKSIAKLKEKGVVNDLEKARGRERIVEVKESIDGALEIVKLLLD
ncbi:hypothetical protein JCM5350_003534 [Sporobolomyces pararoseus]